MKFSRVFSADLLDLEKEPKELFRVAGSSLACLEKEGVIRLEVPLFKDSKNKIADQVEWIEISGLREFRDVMLP